MWTTMFVKNSRHCRDQPLPYPPPPPASRVFSIWQLPRGKIKMLMNNQIWLFPVTIRLRKTPRSQHWTYNALKMATKPSKMGDRAVPLWMLLLIRSQLSIPIKCTKSSWIYSEPMIEFHQESLKNFLRTCPTNYHLMPPFSSGQVPDVLKDSDIPSVPKVPQAIYVGDIRPISLTACISMVLLLTIDDHN